MTRAPDEQLELDFEVKSTQHDHPSAGMPSAQGSASVVFFAAHLHARRERKEQAKDAKLLERITNRVRHFK